MKNTKPIRFMMLGGFLGAGKTTAIAALARHYTDGGQRVAIVTNDQANDLVDTRSLESQGFQVGEVPGACFCCRFEDLVSTMRSLSLDEIPDVIIAEPVGSCTDLVATVCEPIRRFHDTEFTLSPYAVLLKPEHGLKILCETSRRGFSPQAEYIFVKQLEEADVIVINKIDKLSSQQLSQLQTAVTDRFADKTCLTLSAKTEQGLPDLIECLHQPDTGQDGFMDIDYDVYAAGEAELGWLNSTYWLTAKSNAPINIDQFVQRLMEQLADELQQQDAETAHLKVLAQANDTVCIANLVSSDSAPETSIAGNQSAASAEIVVNARVATDPDELANLVERIIASTAVEFQGEVEQLREDALRPGRPVPTHSMRS